jgi:hypothetical protein
MRRHQRPEASMLRIGKSAKERAEIELMAEAVKRYTGPVQHCPPGVACGHEALATLQPNLANRTAPQIAATERDEQTTDELR